MTIARKPSHSVTADHIVPRCQGGTDAFDNLAGACSRCNNLRGFLPAPVFASIAASWGDDLPEPGTRKFVALSRVLRAIEDRKPVKG